MSEELTPEEAAERLRSRADGCHCRSCLRDHEAGDLIESQQARIDELEAAVTGLLGHGEDHHYSLSHHEHDCYELWCIERDHARNLLGGES